MNLSDKIKEAQRTIQEAGFRASDADDITVTMADIAQAVARLQRQQQPVNKELEKMDLKAMMLYVNEVNKAHGWFDDGRPFSADIALLHSEVSEAYEAYRNKRGIKTEYSIVDISKYDKGSVGAELADVFIRLLDTCYRLDIDLEHEFKYKMEYNESRSYRHGGKAE